MRLNFVVNLAKNSTFCNFTMVCDNFDGCLLTYQWLFFRLASFTQGAKELAPYTSASNFQMMFRQVSTLTHIVLYSANRSRVWHFCRHFGDLRYLGVFAAATEPRKDEIYLIFCLACLLRVRNKVHKNQVLKHNSFNFKFKIYPIYLN